MSIQESTGTTTGTAEPAPAKATLQDSGIVVPIALGGSFDAHRLLALVTQQARENPEQFAQVHDAVQINGAEGLALAAEVLRDADDLSEHIAQPNTRMLH
jgi:hypothetical protein